MSEFVSELEKIMPAIELNFEPTPAFGSYKQYLEHAIPHPAKMNTKLLEFLILNFTKEGETILDPMAGSGSTGVVASLHNRNAIQIDIEEKFYKWMEKARKKVEKTITFTPKGKIVNICGDARKLSELLSQADAVITSPPYAEANRGGGIAKKGYEGKYGKDERLHLRHDRPLSDNPDNISNMPFGDIDTIITSPPFANSDMRKSKLFLKMREQPNSNWYNRSLDGNAVKYYLSDGYGSKENIGNLPYVDAVITSPPYSEGIGHDSGDNASQQFKERLEIQRRYTRQMVSEGNIAKLKHGNIDMLAKGLMKNGKPTYLSEMLRVYSEMFKVLKPEGRAIVVVKPFVREKKVVDLPYHTWLLMQQVGFKLEKLFKLRLKQESFWRILYYRRFPDTPKIKHEYILVCKK